MGKNTESNLSTLEKNNLFEQRVCKIFCYCWENKCGSMSVRAESLNIKFDPSTPIQLAPSKGCIRVGTFPPQPEERNRFSSRNGVPYYIVLVEHLALYKYPDAKSA
jgi:hypothetical protein